MTLVSKLSLQLKKKKVNKQAKLYSTTMYTAPRVKRASWRRERAWNGDSGETRVRLGTETWALADHRETGGEWRGGGGGDASPDEEPHRAEQHRPPPHHTQTHTQTDQGAIFSHRSDWLGFHCRRDPPRAASHYLLPPCSSRPFDLPPSTLHCKSDLSKALGYLHTPAHTALYIACHSQSDYCICISVVPVVLCLTGKPCEGIFSTRKQPWLWIQLPTLIKSQHSRTHT